MYNIIEIEHFQVFFIIFLKLFGKNKAVKYAKFLLFSIKLINAIQEYPLISEPNGCILKLFASKFLLVIDFLIYLV